MHPENHDNDKSAGNDHKSTITLADLSASLKRSVSAVVNRFCYHMPSLGHNPVVADSMNNKYLMASFVLIVCYLHSDSGIVTDYRN
jgi:hypothetical protein